MVPCVLSANEWCIDLFKSYSPQVFPHLVPLLLPLTQISLTGSLYTILAVAVERFISISRSQYWIVVIFFCSHVRGCTVLKNTNLSPYLSIFLWVGVNEIQENLFCVFFTPVACGQLVTDMVNMGVYQKHSEKLELIWNIG